MIEISLLKATFIIVKCYITVVHKIDTYYLLVINIILISFYDMKFKKIPNWLICSIIIDLLTTKKLFFLISENYLQLGILILFFVIVNHIRKETFYGGDIKLLLILGLYYGNQLTGVLVFTGIFNIIFHLYFRLEKIPLAPSVLIAIVLNWSDFI